jgi:hypothetical protein
LGTLFEVRLPSGVPLGLKLARAARAVALSPAHLSPKLAPKPQSDDVIVLTKLLSPRLIEQSCLQVGDVLVGAYGRALLGFSCGCVTLCRHISSKLTSPLGIAKCSFRFFRVGGWLSLAHEELQHQTPFPTHEDVKDGVWSDLSASSLVYDIAAVVEEEAAILIQCAFRRYTCIREVQNIRTNEAQKAVEVCLPDLHMSILSKYFIHNICAHFVPKRLQL